MKLAINVIGQVLLLFAAGITFGQTPFNYHNDFKKILARTEDKADSLSYEKLLTRFKANDANMKDFEVLSLLIGFTDKPAYRPYDDLGTERDIYSMNGDGNFIEALDSANVFLKTHPLSVKVLFEKAYSLFKLGRKDSADHYSCQGRRIFSAMNSSGNGKAPETPIYALGPADGQDYIRKFISATIGAARIGSMGSGHDKYGNFLDILEVVPEDGTSSYNLYFIIQHATDKMFTKEERDSMRDGRKRRNGKKN